VLRVDASLEEGISARPGRPRKWPRGAVLMSVYLPADLKAEIERRALARRMSTSEYAVSLMLRGLEVEKEMEAGQDGKAKEVP
jgi:hypothetical protein